MRTFFSVLLLAVSASAFAAPNVANTTQKGSPLIFPDIRVDQGWNTLVRVENDGEVKFTGAYEYSESWHETSLAPGTVAVPGIPDVFEDGLGGGSGNACGCCTPLH